MIGGINAGFSTEVSDTRPGNLSQADPAKVEDAAKQFEALLLAYLLRSAREAGAEGWLGSGEDQTASSALELAEEQFAQTLAAQGGLGLARLIVKGLTSDNQAPAHTSP